MNYFTLTDELFLGKGGERSAYIHPKDNNKIIKILSKEGKHNNQNELDYRYSKYLTQQNIPFTHITKCFGWVDTNKGVGLVFERIKNFDNSDIKTLSYYTKYTILDENDGIQLLKELKQYLFENNILFIDASLSNVFCQKVEKDKFKFIIFDGLGGRRMGFKFWLYLHSKLFTQYKIKKQWEVFLSNYHSERALNYKLPTE